ncbi:MAG: acetyl-CoA carboxylase biotin carboxyl carrier protein subunit, partial [Desulfobulbaceae bacterium]|nr:acetyl-CoA carboxylase biotin carboxyl carrier protein subunit [Desulfobulbaceae bacterium]
HHQRIYLFEPEITEGAVGSARQLGKEEIAELARIGDMRAPFAGNVCDIVVEEGQEIAVGDRLVIIEAMKMQTPVNSEVTGKIGKIFVELGKTVDVGEKLLKIKEDE